MTGRRTQNAIKWLPKLLPTEQGRPTLEELQQRLDGVGGRERGAA
jgi:hypothetical protein